MKPPKPQLGGGSILRGRTRSSTGPSAKPCERYLLEEEVRRSRLGPVYRAIDTELSADDGAPHYVAVQMLPQELAEDEHLLERFKREFAAMQSWSHPNIVKILTFERDRDEYLLTMEHFEGETLRAVLNELQPETLSVEEALAVVAGVGNALDYAHTKGVVHARVNAENVFVTHDYQVKLANFAPAGIAAARDFGTGELDRREDIRGLASLCYELLVGETPQASAGSRRKDSLPRPPGLTRNQWKALRRALEAQRHEQFPSIAAFMAELDLSGREQLRVEQERAARAPARRRRARRWWLAAVPAGFAAAAAAYLYFGDDLSEVVESSRSTVVAALDDVRLPGRRADDADAGDAPSVEAPAGAPPRHAHSEETPATPSARAGDDAAAGGREEEAAAALRAERAAGEEGGAERHPVADEERGAGAARHSDDRAAGEAPAGETGADSTIAAGERAANDAPAADEERVVAELAEDDAARRGPPEGQGAPPQRAAGAAASPGRFSFREASITVRESRGAVAIEIERTGGSAGRASVVWWTSDGTAVADEDYIDLGVRTETFAEGETRRTVYVPIVVDSVPGDQKTFFVHLGEGSGARLGTITRKTVVVLDDS